MDKKQGHGSFMERVKTKYGAFIAFNKRVGTKGAMTVNKWVDGIIAVIVLLLLAAQLVPEAQTAGTTLQSTGAPLSGLFAPGGIVILLIMAGVFYFIYKSMFSGGGK